jgi:aminoglycoside phosphotransferase (APT) family kinase protein
MTDAVPQDLALPYLAAALDERTMAAVFAEVASASGTSIEACHIDRVEYRPRRSCSVGYLLQARVARGRFEQRVSGQLCANGESARWARTAGRRALKASRSGPALVHLAQLDLVTLWWPNDARLDAPRIFTEEPLLRGAVLPEVLAALDPRHCRLQGHQVEIAHYLPGTRLTARVALAWHALEDPALRHERVLCATADREGGGAATHALMRALEASAPWRAGELRTPRSVLWQEAFGLHWQQAVPGRPLLDLLPQPSAPASMQIGMQLAALHGVATLRDRVATLDELRKRPHQVAAVLGNVDRSWAQPLLRLALRLEQGVAALDDAPAVTLHGDLRPHNVRVDAEQRVSLLGLDRVRRGPAALDLGAWIAETLYRVLLEGDTPRNATRAWQAFLAGYAAGGGEFVSEPVLAWATAYQLCQKAARCVTYLKPGRFALTPMLIALAEAIAAAGTPRAAEDGVPALRVQRRETTV